MLDNETVALNRQLAISALELNQGAYHQIKGSLADEHNGRCALGLMAEGVHIPPNAEMSLVYERLAEKLGVTSHFISTVYRKNDNDSLSFKAIAKWLRDVWAIKN